MLVDWHQAQSGLGSVTAACRLSLGGGGGEGSCGRVYFYDLKPSLVRPRVCNLAYRPTAYISASWHPRPTSGLCFVPLSGEGSVGIRHRAHPAAILTITTVGILPAVGLRLVSMPASPDVV